MTDEKKSVLEHSELLTGYDEEKIKARFGRPVYGDDDQLGLKGMSWMRALVYADGIHQGKTDDAAYERAMGQSVKDLNDFFADSPGEDEESDPSTPVGKDDSD